MNKIQTFQDFIATTSVQVPLTSFIINLLLAVILAAGLSR